ncbi:hypothetical protein CHRYSEO8AT_830002 [Chryseobacterium sp. 8AT]|nr:hypothetical protein CHRYSEO8AT_830002 [Chryseobacterium sp. 8AT]
MVINLLAGTWRIIKERRKMLFNIILGSPPFKRPGALKKIFIQRRLRENFIYI